MPVGDPVRWLPPLRVSVELPPGYPSSQPPSVSVHAGWLSPMQLAALQHGLHAAWEEQGAGFPVLFGYLEWLRESGLERLGITSNLQLTTTTSRLSSRLSNHMSSSEAAGSSSAAAAAITADGPAAAPSSPIAEQIAIQLLRYHASKEQEEFESAQQRCTVCFEEQPGSGCIRLPNCHHFFCRACLQQLCTTNVKDGSVEALRCPEPGCRLPIPPHLLQALLTAEEFERWESLLLQRTLDRMQDLVYCPRCETPCIEDADHFAQCAKCLFAFCSMCCSSWHPGSECMDEEQRLLIMSRRRARGGAGAKDTRAEMDLVGLCEG